MSLKRFNIYLSLELDKQLTEYAKTLNQSKSGLVSYILSMYFNKSENQEIYQNTVKWINEVTPLLDNMTPEKRELMEIQRKEVRVTCPCWIRILATAN